MPEPQTTPPLTRGECRPVKRRTRTFRPNYLSFAGTYQCNLVLPALLRADRVDRPARHPDRDPLPRTGPRGRHRSARLHRRRAVPLPGVPGRAHAARRAARLPLRQADDQRRLASRRGPSAGRARGVARRRLHRQDRPVRGQVPRHGHRQARRVLPRRAIGVRSRHDPLAQLRQPSPGQGTRADSSGSRRNSTASSSGRTCSAGTCSSATT